MDSPRTRHFFAAKGKTPPGDGFLSAWPCCWHILGEYCPQHGENDTWTHPESKYVNVKCCIEKHPHILRSILIMPLRIATFDTGLFFNHQNVKPQGHSVMSQKFATTGTAGFVGPQGIQKACIFPLRVAPKILVQALPRRTNPAHTFFFGRD